VPRTIWVGDVHGCAPELADLLEKVELGQEDRLVFVGDLVARGPDTPGVIKIARELSAVCVRGNHEHRMIEARQARQLGTKGPRLSPSHQQVLLDLVDEDWAYLESLPLWLKLPEHNVVVVHAGLLPGVLLEDQDPYDLMYIRSLTSQAEASKRYAERSWAADFKGPFHVVFGHNAQGGLQLHPFATGLDTACVYGCALSALVLEQGQTPPPVLERQDCIVSVPARETYADIGSVPKKW
jgi:hypothetical protein